MSEKHTIRNSIAISVASGLILAFFLSSWVKGMLLTCLHWLWSVIKFMGGLLVHQVETPVWILVLLVTLSIFPILHVVRLLRRKGNDPLEYTYTQDNLFGVVWRWCNSSSGINDLWAFCPHCDLELVYHEQRSDYHKSSSFFPPEFTQFECENCDIKSEKLSGGKSDALGRIEREIRRRLRTGEWKKNLKTEPPTEHRQR